MPLDPELAPLLENNSLPYSELPVDESRRLMLAASQGLDDRPRLAEVADLTAELPGRSLPIRLYRPEPVGKPAPALTYFHGGGWVLGSIATHDGYCRSLAQASGTTILSVDYRLAPEHPFPAAAEDAIDVLRWLDGAAESLGLDPRRLAVGGDSAGGNLAAVAAQQRPDDAPPLACQLLIYPIVDCDFETRSYQENGEGCLLTRATMEWFWRLYAAEPQQRLDPLASPLRATDLRQLPPALVLTAEYDPLRDEGELYARRMADSGGQVQLKRYDGMIHGFVRRLRELKAARRALDQAAGYLRAQLW